MTTGDDVMRPMGYAIKIYGQTLLGDEAFAEVFRCSELSTSVEVIPLYPAMPRASKVTVDDDVLGRAIAKAVNYHGLDSRLNMADYAIADLITPQVRAALEAAFPAAPASEKD